jgi:lipopolysaccharide export system protein LptA
VEIVQNTPQRKRTGTGDHAEYYTEDDKIILRGVPEALMVDSKRGDTHGQELTYFVDDDRLLVNGAPGKPVKSRLHKK